MSGYVLTPTAQQDLLQIRDYYWEQAGHRIARQILTEFVEAFQFLGRTPGAGHKREDLAEARPILFWPMRDYLILYTRPAANYHDRERQPGRPANRRQARTLTPPDGDSARSQRRVH